MKYVLDTNAVSALMKGQARMLGRLQSVDRGDVGVPQPVVAEIAYGISRLPRSKRKLELESRFGLVRSELLRVPWTDDVSDAFGRLKAELERRGRRIEDFDAAIAAHALATQSALVTADAKHMIRAPGLRVEDWTR